MGQMPYMALRLNSNIFQTTLHGPKQGGPHEAQSRIWKAFALAGRVPVTVMSSQFALRSCMI